MPVTPRSTYKESLCLLPIPDATPTTDGVMSAAQAAKLAGIPPGGGGGRTHLRFASASWSQGQFVGGIVQSGYAAISGAPPFFGPAVGGEVISHLTLMIPPTDLNDQAIKIVVGTDLSGVPADTGIAAVVVAGQKSGANSPADTYTLTAGQYLWSEMTSVTGCAQLLVGDLQITNA